MTADRWLVGGFGTMLDTRKSAAVAPDTGLAKRFATAKIAALRRAFGADGATT